VGIALAGTLLVHGAAGMMVFVAVPHGRMVAPPTYRVHLVAAPLPDPNARRAPDVIDRPAERPAPIAVKRPAPKSTVAPAAPPKQTAPAAREAAPRTTANVAPAPGETPSTGNDVATVSTEGIDFPFPEYLDNVVSQVRLEWERPEQSVPLEAEVSFLVHRDGSVTGISFVKRSGNFAFDLKAQGAVEAAGRNHVFGPLPAGWSSDVLFVRFYFSGTRQ
jgi:outer membrane biosynthesis protein TonB